VVIIWYENFALGCFSVTGNFWGGDVGVGIKMGFRDYFRVWQFKGVGNLGCGSFGLGIFGVWMLV